VQVVEKQPKGLTDRLIPLTSCHRQISPQASTVVPFSGWVGKMNVSTMKVPPAKASIPKIKKIRYFTRVFGIIMLLLSGTEKE
jgi:hypothetical protein